MADLSTLDWSALVLAAVLVGFAKSAIGGVAMISIAIFAAVLPARESTGALLPLLLVGDVVAVSIYRRHADWGAVLRLLPTVAAGVGVGAVFVAVVDDTVMRRAIGALLLLLTAVHVWQRHARSKPGRREDAAHWLHGRVVGFGLLAGFTTMVANAGGPVMTLYLLSAGFGMLAFLGTGAWFFLLVNAFKVPFSVGLGLITTESLMVDAALVPGVLVGAVLGRLVIARLDQARFEHLVLACTAVASLNLVR